MFVKASAPPQQSESSPSQATYKSAYGQDQTHMRKVASAKKKLQSKRSEVTAASASYAESPMK